MSFFRLILLSVLFSVFLVNKSFSIPVFKNDSLLLVSLYNATDGPNWTNNENWLTNQPVGEWYGVSVNQETGRVDSLVLKNNNLTGELPENLYELDSLKVLVLNYNKLFGTIPEVHKIPAIGSDSINHNEYIFLFNNYTFRDIENNSKALNEVLNGNKARNHTYGGLRGQNHFGSPQSIRGAPGEELILNTGPYRGTSNNVFKWYHDYTLVAETDEPVFTIPNFNTELHEGRWECVVYINSESDQRQIFQDIIVKGPQNLSPVLDWSKNEFSEKDSGLEDRQIRLVNDSFSPFELTAVEDFRLRNLQYTILSHPQNVQLLFGCGRLGSISTRLSNFEYVNIQNGRFSGCQAYTVLPRKRQTDWVGKDSLVVQVCDEEGACSTDTYYFYSKNQFKPEKVEIDWFSFDLMKDGKFIISWDTIPEVTKFVFKVEQTLYNGCQLFDIVFIDSSTVDVNNQQFNAKNEVEISQENTHSLKIHIYAINESGVGLPVTYTMVVPPVLRNYNLSYTSDFQTKINLSWDIEEGECSGNQYLYMCKDNGPFDVLYTNIFPKRNRTVLLEPGHKYRFYIGPNKYGNVTTHTTSDTISVVFPDREPEIIGSLRWQFQKRFTRLKSSYVKDDIDSTLTWHFTSKRFNVNQTENNFSLQPNDQNWQGIDTLWFSVSDRRNVLDTFAVIDVSNVNTPPRFAVSSDTYISFPIETGMKDDIDLKYLAMDSETPQHYLNFYIVNDESVRTELTGSLLEIFTPYANDSDSSEIIVIVEDEAFARDTMTIRVFFESRENQAPNLMFPESLLHEISSPFYVSSTFEPIPLLKYVTDDTPTSDLIWHIEPIPFYVEKTEEMLDIEVANDTLYINPKPEVSFPFMRYVYPPNPGESFIIYLVAEDKDGGRDSVRLDLVFGEDFPVFKDFPVTDLYPGDTITFNPYDYMVLPESVDTSKLKLRVPEQDAALFEKIDSNDIITAAPGPFYFSRPTNDNIRVYIKYGDQRSIKWEIPVVVHPVRNHPPVLNKIPEQVVSQEMEVFSAIDLKEYVRDDLTPVEHLFWYINDAEFITINENNGVLEAIKIDPNWVGKDTITLVAEDIQFLKDSIQVIFTSKERNSAPVISDIPSQSIAKGFTFAPIVLNEYVTDDFTAPEDIIWSYSGSNHFQIDISEGSAAVNLADPEWIGTDSVLFVAKDEGMLLDSVWVTYAVSVVNKVNHYSEGIVHLSPNPASSYVKIDLGEALISETVKIFVVDVNGIVHFSDKISNQREFIIKTEALPPGVYKVVIEGENFEGRQVETMVKVK